MSGQSSESERQLSALLAEQARLQESIARVTEGQAAAAALAELTPRIRAAQAALEVEQLQEREAQAATTRAAEDKAYQAIITRLKALDKDINDLRAIHGSLAGLPPRRTIPADLAKAVTAALDYLRTFDPESMGIKTLDPQEVRRREAAHQVEAIQERIAGLKARPDAKDNEVRKAIEREESDLARAKKVLSEL